MKINVTSALVGDQKKALAFYTDALGFQEKTNVPTGEHSWLTVAPAFMTTLFGTVAAAIALAVWALVDWGDAVDPYPLVDSICCLVGSIGMTLTYHVPRNDALAAVEPQRTEAAGRWGRYVAGWTRWNHVRAATALAEAAAFTLALP
jgi:uncharacterized membrane protein